ncbi:MAG: YbdK family carboxylate-amine ligase [Aquificota bacterium]|nr:MAG: YbdK family carboxylate-amine ligase [Aquificota bacterium]
MRLKFKNSKPFTVGAELEVQLVDRNTYALSNSSKYIFENLSEKFKSIVQPEVLTSMVEVVTPVCEKPEEVVHYLKEALYEIEKIGEAFGFRTAALGTHVFAKKEETEITAKERYLQLLKELQIVLRQFLIYGFHVHVGFPDKESAVKGYNLIINYLPVFLGISTSSPFFYGEFTGLNSYRTKIFEQLPRAGIPEYFDKYEDFEKLFNELYEGGFVNSIKDIWWDVRIQPNLGTVELRVCDSNPDFERLELIITFMQALSLYAQEHTIDKFFYQTLKQNKWNATRYALKGKFIDKDGYKTIGQKALEKIDFLKKKGIFKELGTESKVTILKDIFRKNTVSENMILVYKKTQDIKLMEEFGFLK